MAKSSTQIVDVYGRPLKAEPRPTARAHRAPVSGFFPSAAVQPATIPAPARPVARPVARPIPEAPKASPSAPPEAVFAPGVRVSPVAVVYVRGRRVAWSLTPDWSPLSPAVGKAYDRARLDGFAGVRKASPVEEIRALLNRPDVSAVMVHSEATDRIVHVSKPADGGSIRAAWSESGAWSPFDDGRSAGGRAAREHGRAGVEVGLEGLRRAVRGL